MTRNHTPFIPLSTLIWIHSWSFSTNVAFMRLYTWIRWFWTGKNIRYKFSRVKFFSLLNHRLLKWQYMERNVYWCIETFKKSQRKNTVKHGEYTTTQKFYLFIVQWCLTYSHTQIPIHSDRLSSNFAIFSTKIQRF